MFLDAVFECFPLVTLKERLQCFQSIFVQCSHVVLTLSLLSILAFPADAIKSPLLPDLVRSMGNLSKWTFFKQYLLTFFFSTDSGHLVCYHIQGYGQDKLWVINIHKTGNTIRLSVSWFNWHIGWRKRVKTLPNAAFNICCIYTFVQNYLDITLMWFIIPYHTIQIMPWVIFWWKLVFGFNHLFIMLAICG